MGIVLRLFKIAFQIRRVIDDPQQGVFFGSIEETKGPKVVWVATWEVTWEVMG